MEIFDYTFYEGYDSVVGSNGFNSTYVGQQRVVDLGILNDTMERDFIDRYFGTTRRQLSNSTHSKMSMMNSTKPFLNMTDREIMEAIQGLEGNQSVEDKHAVHEENDLMNSDPDLLKEETFLYMMSAFTPEGPRLSIRLEGKRCFNRGFSYQQSGSAAPSAARSKTLVCAIWILCDW